MYSVIIADDSKKICEGIKELLENSRPDLNIIGIYHNGKTLLENIQNQLSDIIISDIRMPGADGIQICEYIRSRSADTQIILITAFQEFEYAKKAIDYRAAAFLVKPYTSAQLLEALDSAISHFKRQEDYADAVTDLYLTKREEIKNKVHNIYLGKATADEIANTLMLNQSIPCNELFIIEAGVDYSVTDTLPLNIFDFESPHLSCFAVDKNRIILFYSEDKYVISFFTDSNKEAAFYNTELHFNCTKKMTFDEWNSFCDLRNLAYTLSSALKSMNISDFLQKNADVIKSLTKHNTELLIGNVCDILNTNIDLEGFNIAADDKPENILMQFAEFYFSTDTSQSISQRIKQFIIQNYGDSSLSVSKIADHLSLNSDYISNHFKKETGTTITEFIASIRIEQAKRLLENSDETVNQIALKVGFNDVSYFHRVFKKHTRITPTQFQKRKNEK